MLARMLHDFLSRCREQILATTMARIAAASGTRRPPGEVEDYLPAFYEVLIGALRKDAGLPPGAPAAVAEAASLHGEQRQRAGFAVTEVVHDYGSLCHTILEVASTAGQSLSLREFQLLNQILHQAIAAGVGRFEKEHDACIEQGAAERLGFLAHEMRNALHSASLAFQALRRGQVPPGGRIGDVIERSHVRMRDLLAVLIAQVRVEAGQPPRRELMRLKLAVDDAVALVLPEATRKGSFIAPAVDEDLTAGADPTLLSSMLTNLLQNAIKYSPPDATVHLRGLRKPDGGVAIEVEDRCGGLGEETIAALFKPFAQSSRDRSGLGLGLALVRESAKAHGGTVAVRDLPGKGCVFTVELPGF
jgi:signal transduction histidine kinase